MRELKVNPPYAFDHKTSYSLDEFGYERKDYLEEIQDMIELMLALNNRGYDARYFGKLFEAFCLKIRDRLSDVADINKRDLAHQKVFIVEQAMKEAIDKIDKKKK